MAYSTRHYSNKQEKNVAKNIGGKKVSNSGAPMFLAGDVKTDKFLIECKTATKEQDSFSIRKKWVEKVKEESFSQGKPYWSIAFNFGGESQKENLYIINEELFNELKDLMENY